jgi:hypothetical protein
MHWNNKVECVGEAGKQSVEEDCNFRSWEAFPFRRTEFNTIDFPREELERCAETPVNGARI